MSAFAPFLKQIVSALVRIAIVWLATKFGASVSDDQVTQLTAQIAPVLLVVAWSLYDKYHGRLKLLTAAAAPYAVTEAQVERAVAAGDAPSVLTPKRSIPAL